MAIRAVFFDVGETLVDETRAWGSWADWLGLGLARERGTDTPRPGAHSVASNLRTRAPEAP